MEKIKSILESEFKHDHSICEGWVIETDLQTIKIGISSGQSCCENWGYVTSHDLDSVDTFIGAELLSISHTDMDLNSKFFYKFKEMDVCDVIETPTMFVTIETSAGTLQFVAYNEHNGYYGHDAVVISRQLNIEATL